MISYDQLLLLLLLVAAVTFTRQQSSNPFREANGCLDLDSPCSNAYCTVAKPLCNRPPVVAEAQAASREQSSSSCVSGVSV